MQIFFLTCLHITQHLFSRSKTYFFQNKYTETCCTSIKSTPSDFFFLIICKLYIFHQFCGDLLRGEGNETKSELFHGKRKERGNQLINCNISRTVQQIIIMSTASLFFLSSLKLRNTCMAEETFVNFQPLYLRY